MIRLYKILFFSLLILNSNTLLGQQYCPNPISPSLNIMHLRFSASSLHFEDEPVLNEGIWIYAIKYNETTETTVCLGKGIYEGGIPLTITVNGQDDFGFGYLPNDTIQLLFERNNGCLTDEFAIDNAITFEVGMLKETDFVEFFPKYWANLNPINGFCAENTASINVNSPNDQSPFTFEWNTGNNNDTLNNLADGLYTLSLTNAFGCIEIHEAEVMNIPEMQINLMTEQMVDSFFCESTAEIMGGTEPFIYEWSDGQSTSTATGIENGDFSVIVTDANGCEIQAMDDCIINSNKEKEIIESLEIFPNPVNEKLNIKITLNEHQEINVTLRNLWGSKLIAGTISGNQINRVFDVSNLINGVYFLEFEFENLVIIKRIIVQ